MELKITKEKVIEASLKYATSKEILETLFPEVFANESWELKIKDNKEIYFVNTVTNQSFNIGDRVTIKDTNMRFGDGVRKHIIRGFFYPSYTESWTNSMFNKVWVVFKGYDNDRTLSLDELVKL